MKMIRAQKVSKERVYEFYIRMHNIYIYTYIYVHPILFRFIRKWNEMRRRYLMERGNGGTLDKRKKKRSYDIYDTNLFLYTSLGRIPRNQDNEINRAAEQG